MSQIDLPRRHHLDAITSERWTASDQNRWTPSVRYDRTASLESAAFWIAASLERCDISSATMVLTIAIVTSSAGNNISNANSDSVTSVGVPKIVVVFRNETMPSRVAICNGVA